MQLVVAGVEAPYFFSRPRHAGAWGLALAQLAMRSCVYGLAFLLPFNSGWRNLW